MTNNAHILATLQREFPAPPIAPQWVDDCVAALLEAGMDASVNQVREQYLYSDLAASTIPSDAIPEVAHDNLLFLKPTLLQIISLTEIGSSAFQLQTVLEQRKEVISGATRIRRMDDGEEGEADGEDGEEQDKMPAYPRGMLKMELADGFRVVKAIEYKRLGGLKLGETCLGAKVVLHRIRALRGTLLLTPETVTYLGYEVNNLEAEKPAAFLRSLKERMANGGQGGNVEQVEMPPPPAPRRAPAARAPARAPPPARPTSTINTTNRLTFAPGTSPRNSTPGPSRQRIIAPQPVASPYFSINGSTRQNPSARARPRASEAYSIDDMDEYDESFLRQVEEAEAMASNTTGTGSTAQGTAVTSVGYVDVEDDDDDWFAEVDVDQLDAIPPRPASDGRAGRTAEAEIIEISD